MLCNKSTMADIPSGYILSTHRSVIATIAHFFRSTVPIVITYCIVTILNRTLPLPIDIPHHYITTLLLAFCGIFLAEHIRRYFNHLFIFSESRIIHLSGRLSRSFRRSSISYDDVREIRISQNVLGRIFNYGTLKFGTASTVNYEIEFADIADPESLSHLVEEIMQSRKASLRTDYQKLPSAKMCSESH